MSHEPGKKKKKKKRSIVLDYLNYCVLRTLVAFVSLFPVEANLKTAAFLGRQLWKFYHRGRLRALENLRASFPEKSEQELVQIGRRSFEQIVMLVMDVLYTPRLVKRHNWREYSSYKHIERIKWMMQEGRGLLLVTGHYGNFEIVGYLMGLFGFNVYSVARPLDNPFINKYLYSVRERAGQKIIDKKAHQTLWSKSSQKAALSVLSPIRTPAEKEFSWTSLAVKPVPTRA